MPFSTIFLYGFLATIPKSYLKKQNLTIFWHGIHYQSYEVFRTLRLYYQCLLELYRDIKHLQGE